MSIEISLAGGETIAVRGSFEEVEKALSDAARSGQSRMAFLTAAAGDARIGVNPAQVTMLRESSR
jgi:hypothetical protein